MALVIPNSKQASHPKWEQSWPWLASDDEIILLQECLKQVIVTVPDWDINNEEFYGYHYGKSMPPTEIDGKSLPFYPLTSLNKAMNMDVALPEVTNNNYGALWIMENDYVYREAAIRLQLFLMRHRSNQKILQEVPGVAMSMMDFNHVLNRQ